MNKMQLNIKARDFKTIHYRHGVSGNNSKDTEPPLRVRNRHLGKAGIFLEFRQFVKFKTIDF